MPTRAELFERCKQSVDAQAFHDFEHVILRDEIGVGVAEAQKMLWKCSPRGEYVLVLDDDDYLSASDVLAKLYAALTVTRPCFAVVKVAHGTLGEMPRVWSDGNTSGEGAALREGDITVSNVVVEHVQWYLHRGSFGARYAGDFDFISSLFAAHKPQWIDVSAVTVERMRNGAGEMAVSEDAR